MKYQDRITQPTYIKREFVQRIRDDRDWAGALALSLLMKSLVPSSTVKAWNPYQLYKLTCIDGKGGVDPKTVEKYLDILREENLIIEQNGKNGKKSLTFKSLKSGVEKNNIEMTYFGYKTLKEAKYYLYSLLFMEEIHHKMYVKEMLYLSHNGFDINKTKQAKRMCRKHGWNRHKDDKFEDWGISFKTIAKKLGVSEQTAQYVVNFAVKNKLVNKFNQGRKVYSPGSYVADKYLLPQEKNYTYVTKDDVEHYISANIYRIVPNWGIRMKIIQKKMIKLLNTTNRLFKNYGIRTYDNHTLNGQLDNIIRCIEFVAIKNNKNWSTKSYVDKLISFNKEHPKIINHVNSICSVISYNLV